MWVKKVIKYILYFLISGGIITGSAFLAERSGPVIASILLVLPNVSLVAFYFINRASGLLKTIQVIKVSFLSTMLVWPFYALCLLYFAPKLGVNKALLLSALATALVSIGFIYFCKIPLIRNWVGN